MKKTFFMACCLTATTFLFAQNKDISGVKETLNKYKTAIEKLDTVGVTKLFVVNSKVFEQGSDEGTIGNYLGHHLGPELKEFSSFKFSDYTVNVKLAGSYAFSTETYTYTIVLAKDSKEIKSKGIATSILQKLSGQWKIVQTHSSFRRAK